MTSKTELKDNLALDYAKDRLIKKKDLLIRILILVIFILISILLFMTTIIYFYDSGSQYVEYIKNDENTSWRIIPRAEWQAVPPKELTPLSTPVPNVIILHTATETCSDQAKCSKLTRIIQTFHMESWGWDDIAYSFLIGGDGHVYEGHGWNNKGSFAHVWNPKSIGIGFIGTFIRHLPSEKQILAGKKLIEKGVKDGYIIQDYKLYAHRQVSSTESPGTVFYENIKTWPHWTNKSFV